MALVDEKCQEQGPARHGPGRRQPLGRGRSSSLPAISSARSRPLSTPPSTFYLSCSIITSSQQLRPGVLLQPPGMQPSALEGVANPLHNPQSSPTVLPRGNTHTILPGRRLMPLPGPG